MPSPCLGRVYNSVLIDLSRENDEQAARSRNLPDCGFVVIGQTMQVN